MPLDKPTPTELLANAPALSLDEALAALPEYTRDDIQKLVEKALVAEFRGDIKLKSGQLASLNNLARKYLENPPTIKEEDDPVDFLALLNSAYKDNASAFDELTKLADSFREQENVHRATLDKAKAEIREQEELGQHMPVLSTSDLSPVTNHQSPESQHEPYSTQAKKNVSTRLDLESEKNNRFDEMVNLQGDGVQPSWPTDFIQHESG